MLCSKKSHKEEQHMTDKEKKSKTSKSNKIQDENDDIPSKQGQSADDTEEFSKRAKENKVRRAHTKKQIC
jgi:hypothetical protein